MSNVIVAELAELLQFHTIRISLLVLVRNVISLFAVRASQCNSDAHDATSNENIKMKPLYYRIKTNIAIFRAT